MWNPCYHSVRNLPSSRTVSKLKIKIRENISLPAVLYEYETWPLILRQKHRVCMKTKEC